MMAVDTSAPMAVVLDEPEADRCKVALEEEPELLISAGTVAKGRSCSLLYVGEDFAKTDLESAV